MAVQQDNLIRAIARLIVEEVPQLECKCYDNCSIYLLIQRAYAGIVYLNQDVLNYHYHGYYGDFRLPDPECFQQLGHTIVKNFELFNV